MKRIILCLSLFAFFGSQAQQINPVPDYVFRNQMSVGRNAVTDTAAYFSVGPRYGAVKGMMPPMVIDTASMSATKRNGLLIFSIQKNKYLYWDSVGSKWAEMAGTAGSAITGSGVAGYMPEFTTATNIDTTRLYHSAGRFGIGTTSPANELHVVGNIRLGASNAYQIGNDNKSLSVTNRVTNQRALVIDTANSIFFGTLTSADGGSSMLNVNMQNRTVNVGNILNVTDTGTFGSGVAVRASALQHQIMTLWNIAGFDGNSNQFLINSNSYYDNVDNRSESMKSGYSHQIEFNSSSGDMVFRNTSTSAGAGNTAVTFVENMKINAAGELLINTSDQGAYPLQVGGTLYTSTGAILAASSGNVGIGTTSPGNKLHVNGTNARVRTTGGNHGFEFDNGRTGFISGGSDIIHIQTSGAVRGVFQADGEFLVNTTTDAGAYALQVAGAIYNTTTITTGAPTGGSIKPWRLGEAATVSPTSPNRTIRVEIDGTVYYIHAKTTND